MEPLLVNRKARAEYSFIDEMEAGLVLSGPEVKSLRAKRASINEAFVRLLGGEAWLVNANIQQYDFTPGKVYDPTHSRKLLLHKREVNKLAEMLSTKGMTAVPLMIGISHHYLKVLIGVGKGKKTYERREELKRRDLDRETAAAVKRAR